MIKFSMRALFTGQVQNLMTFGNNELVEMRRNILQITGKGVKAGEVLVQDISF